MPKITNVEFQGASGRKYVFGAYTLESEVFKDVGGVYIFAKEVFNQYDRKSYYPLYIGQTNSFRRRIVPNHDRWPCAVTNGVNRLCILAEENTFSRRAIELDLLSKYNTPCNKNK